MPPARRIDRRTLAGGLTAVVTAAVLAVGLGSVAAAQVPPGSTTVPPTTGPPLATSPPVTTPPTTEPVDTSGRQWLVPVPIGCEVPALPDVVFVGTLVQTGTPSGSPQTSEFETGRFRVDQARAGAIERYSYNGFIDVRYGIDMKYLDEGQQYLVGASVASSATVLGSKVREPEPLFGGDEVIGAAESDVTCPVIVDPVRTVDVDGTPVDAGVLSPLADAKTSILRSLVVPMAIAFGIIFGLVLLRWILTGLGKGVGSVVRTASEPREVRAATRTRPGVRHD
ncbi:MAG: hypothetical protein ABW195_06630 [Ilumatobacteraceae bacterium]